MTYRVTVRPSGHQFTVERGESVLEAALRSGLSLDYNCSNGTCGDCRARLLEGEIAEERPHDYVIRSPEREQGAVLLCSITAGSDLVIEAREASDAADIPAETISTTVHKLERPTPEVAVLELRTPRSRSLRFLAGQHARIRLDGLEPRSMSIASCPCNGMYLQFHVRHAAGDPFAEQVFNRLKPREKVEIEGPFGRFTLDEDSRRPLIFLAYETGFASIKSLVEHAIALEKAQPMRLYWVARRPGDHYLANYCRSWEDAFDDFQYTLVASEDVPQCDPARSVLAPEAAAALSAPQRAMALAGAHLVADHPDLGGFDVYVSGPESILTAAKPMLLAHGLPQDRLFVDHIERH